MKKQKDETWNGGKEKTRYDGYIVLDDRKRHPRRMALRIGSSWLDTWAMRESMLVIYGCESVIVRQKRKSAITRTFGVKLTRTNTTGLPEMDAQILRNSIVVDAWYTCRDGHVTAIISITPKNGFSRNDGFWISFFLFVIKNIRYFRRY